MKNHHHNGPIHLTSREIIHNTIASRAYELWEGYGRPENQSDEIWMEAERELVNGQIAPVPAVTLPISF
jgi:hypothetical protein